MFDGRCFHPARRLFRVLFSALGDRSPELTGDFQLTQVRYLRVVPRTRTTLRCTQGRAWVTLECDSQDYFLLCGERMTLEAGRWAVIEGIPECRLSVQKFGATNENEFGVRLDAVECGVGSAEGL